ncbi:hypothetical protein [Leptolyngbya sp. FACHB-261]|uniref:hypothetical protein n=1 Tax=Leptolyngbya sp. FACHB-261 TaxID=2692806 RepID=UPI001688C08E|nr:hypothetical protein [Leptolyngbya sp. FACHB-261]MBD2100196.1 hypothetical protein [Leptolyngbya sp. FACHB-261]
MYHTNYQHWLQNRPSQFQGNQRALATLLINLEETEEEIEVLQNLHADLLSRIAEMQQRILIEQGCFASRAFKV